MAGQVLTLADDQRAQIAQEARDDAAAIREAAQREAAAIRGAAQREATEQKARLDWMLDELGKVLAASVAAPALPETAPAHVGEGALPRRTRPAAIAPAGADAVGATAAPPATMPAPPDTTSGTRPATVPVRAPAKTRTAPAKPTGKPVTKEQGLGRQKRAMRVVKYGTAAMLLFALGAAGLEVQHNGYGFFVFRENGQGDSPSSGPGRVGVDQQDGDFLAAQAAARAKAAQHAPRHAKTSPSSTGTTAPSTTGG